MKPRRRTVSYSDAQNGEKNSFDTLRNSALESMIKTLNIYRRTSLLCDFIIKIDGESFPVHKVIISASSPFFAALFDSADENRYIENSRNCIELQEISATNGEKIIAYLYTGDIDLNPDNVQEIAKASSMYQLSNLFDLCLEYMFSNIDTVNAIGLLCFAEYYASNCYKIRIKRYVEQNFSEICTGEEFSMLPESILKSFLRSEDLSIFSEDEVLVATLNWFKHDESRMKFFQEFIGYLRMPLVSSNEIQKIRKNFSDTDILKQFEELLDPKPAEDCEKNTPYFQIRFQPRFCVRKRLFVIENHGELKILVLDMAMDSCKILRGPWLPEPPSAHAGSCILNDNLYVLGGQNTEGFLETFQRLNIREKGSSWESLSRMYFKRAQSFLFPHNGRLFVAGGRSPLGNLPHQGAYAQQMIEVFDPEANSWSIYGNAPAIGYDYSIVKIAGFLYFMPTNDPSGGWAFCRYDIDNKTFERLPCFAPDRKRDDFVTVSLRDSIYVIGGRSRGHAVKFVDVYDIRSKTWHQVAPLRVACCGMKAFACNNLIYVLNAHGHKNRSRVEVYDPTIDQWYHKTWFPTPNAMNFESTTVTISD